jgi:acetyl-CoA acetyltransferase
MNGLSKRIAIVAVAESDEIGHVPDKSSLQHHAEAAYNALDDCGLAKGDVDGLLTAGLSTVITAEYMGIQPSFTDSTYLGGSSFVVHVAHAVAAIRAGYCEVAMITHGQAGRSGRSRPPEDAIRPYVQYEVPYGITHPPMYYSMMCTRYMHEHGEARTREGLAEIAVATRRWAHLNPRALMHDRPMSFQDYHDSRWISWPFHLLDCCLVTDAGAAVVITTEERARDLDKRPVWVLGAAEGHDHDMVSQMPDLTSSIAAETGRTALAMAGVSHADIDLAMLYDSFTYTVLASLEALGFCGRGEGPDFVKGQRTAPGGDFPLNTNGGGLSYTHPGMYGIFTVVEAVRQLRGEVGDRQVNGCETALAHGTGGSMSSTGTVVLATG